MSAGKVTREELFILTKVISRLFPKQRLKHYDISELLRSFRVLEIDQKM
jgi:hypothetical protein